MGQGIHVGSKKVDFPPFAEGWFNLGSSAKAAVNVRG